MRRPFLYGFVAMTDLDLPNARLAIRRRTGRHFIYLDELTLACLDSACPRLTRAGFCAFYDRLSVSASRHDYHERARLRFSLAESAEGGPHLAGERLGLLQGGEVASLVQLVPVAQVREDPLRPPA